MKKALLYSLLVFGLISGTLYATDCFTGHCFVPQRKNIVQKVNTHNFVDVLQKRVVFDQDYYLGLDGYYSVQQNLVEQDEALNRKVLLKQSEQLEKFLDLLIIEKKADLAERGLINGNGPVAPQPPQPPQNPEPNDPPSDPVPFPQPIPDDEWDGGDNDLNVSVHSIFKTNCMSCHGEDAKNRMVLGGDDWLANLSLDERVLVYDHTAGINLAARGKKLMPLGGPALNDANVEVLRLWMISEAERLYKTNSE